MNKDGSKSLKIIQNYQNRENPVTKMTQMDQNQTSKCLKMDQNHTK